MKFISLGLLFAQSICPLVVYSWVVPPANFINEFAIQHQLTSITIYLPTNMADPCWISWYRKYFSKSATKMVFKFPKQISEPTSNRNLSDNSFALIVFIPNEADLVQSISDFVKIRSEYENVHDKIWLFDISYWSTPSNAVNAIAESPLKLDDDLYLYKIQKQDKNNSSNNNNDLSIELWEHYQIHETIPKILVRYGNWRSKDDAAMNQTTSLNLVSEEKWIRRRDLQGVHFRILSNPWGFYTTMDPIIGDDDGNTFEMGGMYAEFWFSLQETLNFTYTLRKPPDGQYGRKNPDGSWNGMVGELISDNTDIAVAGFGVSFARSQVVSFARAVTTVFDRLLIKNPYGKYNYRSYIDPYVGMSWICIVLFWILTPPFLYLTVRYGKKDPKHYEFTWIKSTIYVLSSMTQRGWNTTPISSSAKISFFIIMLFSAILYYLWEAMLISYLAARVTVLPFTGIETLVANSDFKIAVNPNSYQQSVFENSVDPIWQTAWQDRIKPNMKYYEEIIDKNMFDFDKLFSDPSMALYTNNLAIVAFPQYLSCELLAIPAKYGIRSQAFAFQKNSPYLELFNYYLKAMDESGISDRILERYKPQAQYCPDKSGQPIGIDSCISGFLIIFGGIIIGMALFLIEKIASKLFDVDISQIYERTIDIKNSRLCRNCKSTN